MNDNAALHFTATVVSRDTYELKAKLDPERHEVDIRFADRMGPGRHAFPNSRGVGIPLQDIPDLIDPLTLIEGRARQVGLLDGGAG